jgi:hypothetical protein
LLEQLQAGVPAINKYPGNQAAVSIHCVRPELDIFTEHQFAHGLLGALANAWPFSGASINAIRAILTVVTIASLNF